MQNTTKEEQLVEITRYQMVRLQKRVYLTFMVRCPNFSLPLEIDVRKRMINMTLIENTLGLLGDLANTMYKCLPKKTEFQRFKNNTIFVKRDLLLEVLAKFETAINRDSKNQQTYKTIVAGVDQAFKQIDNRTLFLEREEEKRNRSFEKKQKIVIIDQGKDLEAFKKDFDMLLITDYIQTPADDTLEKLINRVKISKQASVTPPLQRKFSSIQDIHFSKMGQKYKHLYERFKSMKGLSSPTLKRLPKGLTSLYVVRTDKEIVVDGVAYNVVKVGKTNISIHDYEHKLYEDYKSKILFKHIYLGIFQEQANTIVDNYFHDRLVKIPKSKYFIFNYTDYETNVRVAQQFYLLTEEFVQEMAMLLQQYCGIVKNYPVVKQ